MVVSDESMAFPRWKGILKKRRNVSVYQFYDTLFGASEHAVTQGRRSRVQKGGVVNKTSEYGYSVPHQWQGSYDHHIEVRRFAKIQTLFPIEDLFFMMSKNNQTLSESTLVCSLETVPNMHWVSVLNACFVYKYSIINITT